MSEVEFDTDTEARRSYAPQNSPVYSMPGTFNSSSSGMMGWLMKHSLAKSESGANGILIGFVGSTFVIAGLILNYYVFQ